MVSQKPKLAQELINEIKSPQELIDDELKFKHIEKMCKLNERSKQGIIFY